MRGTVAFLDRILSSIDRGRDALRRRLGRAAAILPWMSLAYGVVSGVTITRDYAHSTTLLGSLAGMLVLAIALRLWTYRSPASTPLTRYGSWAMQLCTQYVLMFCIPLLFFAHAWITGGLAVLAAASSLWDRWWRKLSPHPTYLTLVRVLVAVLATSYAFAVFFPQALRWFYPTLGLVALTTAAPWDALLRRRRPTLPELGIFAVVMATVVAQAALATWIRVPLLSVWMRHPALGVGVVERTLREPWSDSVGPAQLEAVFARGDELCCLTPIVSPSGVQAPVVHEWRIDDRLVDRIVLAPVRGGDGRGETAFRTFSCKWHLAHAESVRKINCRVLLDDSIYLGEVATSIEP